MKVGHWYTNVLLLKTEETSTIFIVSVVHLLMKLNFYYTLRNCVHQIQN